ncbi:tRNA methyltransferase 10 homolog A-like [Xenia sp. Carnegie-2017]|uniref:tRNA methyltransferase 10 homolog A-like n=1 Tax=Xenia sp. Carnegie-2017 TaxID=2897299 RepID=UPI001F04B70C|nr:tRNA methyltransferase 10 homolog A-like [Xenia sp. Carnegie-2017]
MTDSTTNNDIETSSTSKIGAECSSNLEKTQLSNTCSSNDVSQISNNDEKSLANNQLGKMYSDGKLSKRKLKRLKNHQKWVERKQEKKLLKKEKIRKAKAEGLPVPKSRSSRRCEVKKMDCEEALPVKIAIDMSYESFMDERSMKKLLKQVKTCYAVNRKSSRPIQFYLTGFEGNIQLLTEGTYQEYKSWDIHIKKESYIDVFHKENIVYLTSDSENILEDIDLSKAYIIGGLVDHNHHKGLCHKLAVENKVAHAQLPIKNFVKIQSRTVLTVNHVFEIILKYLELKDWQKAFYDVIPKRKGVSLVDTNG